MGWGKGTADCKECSLDNMKMRYKVCNKCILDYYIEYSDYLSSDTFNYHKYKKYRCYLIKSERERIEKEIKKLKRKKKD